MSAKSSWLRQRMHPTYARARLSQARESAAVFLGLRRLSRSYASDDYDFRRERDARLRKMLQYAERHTTYYRELFRKHEVNVETLVGFSELPTLDKTAIKKDGEQLTSDLIRYLPHATMNTGGSTGEPLEFLASGGNIDPLHQWFFWRVLGYTRGDKILACDGSVVSAERRARGLYWTRKKNPAYGHVALSALYFDDNTSEKYVASLLRMRPAFVRGYPSMIADLASALLARGLELDFPVKGVVLTSECALDGQVATIERAFRAPVAFQYGHSEGCVFGFATQSTGGYLCSPYYGLTEVMRPDGRPAAVGESGEIVVTGFHSWAMPLVRYRTGDVGVFGGDERGMVRILELRGRTQDVIVGAGGERVGLTALVFGCHYRAFGNIKKWQIVQREVGAVVLRIVKAEGYTRADEEELLSSFSRVGRVRATFEYVNEVPLTTRGKSHLLIQELPGVTV